MSEPTTDEITAEANASIDANWDPDITVAEWWQRLADAKYSHPMLPVEAGGLAWSTTANRALQRAMAAKDVLGPPTGLGMMLAAPTIAMHGSPEQIERFVKPI
ncbi:MAG: acyl-CoA dehydrogenase, partial [Acidimicrobiales bacterium]|nr:acyl-CoA dehydrogenase [Acidimicrobiales bacterium]